MEIIIYVEGGMVQDVFTDEPYPVKVIIYDRDNIEQGDKPPVNQTKMKMLLKKGMANIGNKTFNRIKIYDKA